MSKAKPIRRVGSLEVIEIPGQPGGPCILVLHGYGADAYDLLSISQLLTVPAGTTWLFANGPEKISGGGIYGRAWFEIDVAALEEAMRSGTHRDMSRITPPGMKQARNQVLEMLKELNIPVSRTVLAGFSQGAMLATDIALRSEEKPLGLVILSGTLLNEDQWKEKAKIKAGLPFFQSHGDRDPLLGFEHAQRLEKVLTDAGLKGQSVWFQGGHEVPQEVMYKLNQFLAKVLSPAQRN